MAATHQVVAMKRCDLCGRTGARMLAVRSRWVDRVISARCHNVAACNARVRTLGKWIGTRVLRRTDADGTRWTIRRARDGVSGGPLYTLTCEYRQHRATMIASWTARTLRDYTEARR